MFLMISDEYVKCFFFLFLSSMFFYRYIFKTIYFIVKNIYTYISQKYTKKLNPSIKEIEAYILFNKSKNIFYLYLFIIYLIKNFHLED